MSTAIPSAIPASVPDSAFVDEPSLMPDAEMNLPRPDAEEAWSERDLPESIQQMMAQLNPVEPPLTLALPNGLQPHLLTLPGARRDRGLPVALPEAVVKTQQSDLRSAEMAQVRPAALVPQVSARSHTPTPTPTAMPMPAPIPAQPTVSPTPARIQPASGAVVPAVAVAPFKAEGHTPLSLTKARPASAEDATSKPVTLIPEPPKPQTSVIDAPAAANLPTLDAGNANHRIKAQPGETLDTIAERVPVLTAGSEKTAPSLSKAAVVAEPPKAQTQQPTAQLSALPLPATPGAKAAYLQVPFDNGAIAGQVTISKASAELSAIAPLSLQMTTSNAELDSHLRAQLTQADMPWQMRDEQGNQQQPRHAQDELEPDDEQPAFLRPDRGQGPLA